MYGTETKIANPLEEFLDKINIEIYQSCHCCQERLHAKVSGPSLSGIGEDGSLIMICHDVKKCLREVY